MAKAALELLEPSHESLNARGRCVIDQCASAYRNRVKSTMSSNQITRENSTKRSDLSGRAMALIGLRMMPTFPSPSLKFRTASFPQYGFKASLSDRAFQSSHELKSTPDMRS